MSGDAVDVDVNGPDPGVSSIIAGFSHCGEIS